MEVFILIWMLHHGDHVYSGSGEFNSKENCVAAGKRILDKVTFTGTLYHNEFLECVKK